MRVFNDRCQHLRSRSHRKGTKGAHKEPALTLNLTPTLPSQTLAGTLRFDNIVITGTQIVPEPATMLLLSVGVAGIAAEVRRRRRARR